MDIPHLKQIFTIAAIGSLILLGSTAVLAGNRSPQQPPRTHISAACAPHWGFNQTCWSRFPPVQGCPGTSCDCMPKGDTNYPSQQLAPLRDPSIPDASFIPGLPVPGASSTLPPLPTPPIMSPVSFTNALVPNARLMPIQRQIQPAHRRSSQSPATSSVGSRYGNAARVQPAQFPPVAFYPTIQVEPLVRQSRSATMAMQHR